MSEYDYKQKFFEIIGESRISVILSTVFCIIILFDFPFIFVHSIIKTIATAIDIIYQVIFGLIQGGSVGSIAEIPLVVGLRQDFRELQILITGSQHWKDAMNMRKWSKVLCVVVFSIRGMFIALYLWRNSKSIYDDFYEFHSVTPCHIPSEWIKLPFA